MNMTIPRPEYPRPDFMRLDWVNLNGVWRFAFDDYDLGLKEKWFKRGDFDEKIIVPFPFQSRLSGIHDECFHDIVWYARTFNIPEDFTGKTVFLKFGAVDYFCNVWLNGVEVGSHVGGYTPFEFNITNLVKEDNNLLVLRIEDRHGDQPRGKQDARLYPRGCNYMRVTGIWQTVWLEFTERSWIRSARFYPKVSGEVGVEVGFGGELRDLTLETTVFFTGYEVLKRVDKVSGKELKFKIEIEDPKLWTPETPDLYKVKLALRNGEKVEDEVYTYFGLREVTVKNGRILLNGKPYYLRFALDQGYWLDGLYTAPSDEALKRDVEYVKKLGLNGVRKHQKPEDPRYFYWCDKIGILVWEEMADWGMSLTSKNLETFWKQWKDVILRDFNHPSIIAWVPFNERCPNEGNVEEHINFIVEVYKRTKRLDPTRLVVDNSGYCHTLTDIVDIHDYSGWRGGKYFKENWEKSLKKGLPYCPHRPVFLPGFKYEGQPIVLSEWGGWGIKKYDPLVNRPKAYYGPELEDEYEFLSKYRDLIKAIYSVHEIAGFCYTQLYDIEGEVNGYLTYDRKWKVDPEKIREIHLMT